MHLRVLQGGGIGLPQLRDRDFSLPGRDMTVATRAGMRKWGGKMEWKERKVVGGQKRLSEMGKEVENGSFAAASMSSRYGDDLCFPSSCFLSLSLVLSQSS